MIRHRGHFKRCVIPSTAMPESQRTAQELCCFVRFTSTFKFPMSAVLVSASHRGVTLFLSIRQREGFRVPYHGPAFICMGSTGAAGKISESQRQTWKIKLLHHKEMFHEKTFHKVQWISGKTQTNRLPGTGQPRESMCSRRRFRRRAQMPGRGIWRANRQALST